MAARNDQQGRASERAVPRLRQRFETLVLSVGATVIGVVVVLMAAHRLSDNKDNGTTTEARKPATTATTTAQAPTPAPVIDAAAERRALTALADAGHPIYCGGTAKGMVALTFDQGPGQYTHFVLRRLQRNKLRATFFLVGANLATYGNQVAEQLRRGAVGSQTLTHPNLTTLGAAQRRQEITGGRDAVAKAAKQQVQLFRPPYGERDAKIDGTVQRAGMVEVLWSADSGDTAAAGAATIRKTVIAALKPGAIIRLHDNQGQTVKALPAILHAIRSRHLRAVSLPLMLTADPPSRRQLRLGRSGC